jgi:hypothetical protein
MACRQKSLETHIMDDISRWFKIEVARSFVLRLLKKKKAQPLLNNERAKDPSETNHAIEDKVARRSLIEF